MTMTEAMQAEKEMRIREYEILINHAIERLQDAKNRTPSTHLGHNLGNDAHNLSVAAAKIEAATSALNFLKAVV